MHWEFVLEQLEKGKLRAAQKQGDIWKANPEVKKAILEAFEAGELQEREGFIDKHNLMPRKFTKEDQVRMVPGGSSVRRGSYIAKNVIIMPPSYVNVGAYVDQGTLVDGHVLVGSLCSNWKERSFKRRCSNWRSLGTRGRHPCCY